MKKETYIKINTAVNSSGALRGLVIAADWTLTKLVYVTYPLLLAYLAIKKEPGFLPALLVPGISFILLSIFRAALNSPRPYEVFGVRPVIDRKGSGKSFPSRHVFSVFIIAFTMFTFSRPLGLVMLAIGLLIALDRVIGGVHFPRDVIAGAVIALLCGLCGFYLLTPAICSIF